jgi:2-dehydro-3-deoxygluconokinase
MKAVYYEGSGRFTLGECEVRPPQPGEVRLAVAYCAQRPELHRAWVRRARGTRLLRSWALDCLTDASRGCRLGADLRLRRRTIVSYDLNFRPSLWKASGLDAPSVNRALVPHVDVLLGNEEDFSAGLGYTLDGVDERLLVRDVATYETLLTTVMADHPQLALTAATLRDARTATLNDWSGVCRTRTSFHMGPRMGALEIFDRVGGGDSFVSGLVYGLLGGLDVDTALAYGVAHGALAMTTPGDTSMATLEEVERLVAGASPRVIR